MSSTQYFRLTSQHIKTSDHLITAYFLANFTDYVSDHSIAAHFLTSSTDRKSSDKPLCGMYLVTPHHTVFLKDTKSLSKCRHYRFQNSPLRTKHCKTRIKQKAVSILSSFLTTKLPKQKLAFGFSDNTFVHISHLAPHSLNTPLWSYLNVKTKIHTHIKIGKIKFPCLKFFHYITAYLRHFI